MNVFEKFIVGGVMNIWVYREIVMFDFFKLYEMLGEII